MLLHAVPKQTLLGVPDGPVGTRQTLQMMAGLVQQYRMDPNIRGKARDLVSMLPAKGFRAEVRALFEFVQRNIRYLGDVNGVETLQDPLVTLRTGAGDCDDMSTLLASLLESIGHASQFVAVGFSDPNSFEHVYVRTLVGPNGDPTSWVGLDATMLPERCAAPPCPGYVGWEPPSPFPPMIENI